MMDGERRHVIGGVGGGVVIMVFEGCFGVMFVLNIKLLMIWELGRSLTCELIGHMDGCLHFLCCFCS